MRFCFVGGFLQSSLKIFPECKVVNHKLQNNNKISPATTLQLKKS